MNNFKKITVCGCGNAGMAIAADLSLLGHKVTIYEVPAFKNTLDAIKINKGINITGDTISGKTGLVKPSNMTTNEKEAIEGADIIMFAVPATAHEKVLERLLPYLVDGQTILVHMGYFAAIRFNKLLEKNNLANKILVVEAHSIPYLAGRITPAHVHIFRQKKVIKVSAWPSKNNDKILPIFKNIYPQFILSRNILENNFFPSNPSVHAQIALPNAVFFFDRAREFKFYAEVSMSATKLSDAFDKERIEVAHAFECDTLDVCTALKERYGYVGSNLYEIYINSEHKKRWGNIDAIFRVLKEDLCYFFIPMEQLARVAGIKVPITTSIINIMKVFTDYDYHSEGLSLINLGIPEYFNKNQIVDYFTNGVIKKYF